MADFVNPYTFVPLAGEPERRAPVSHAAMGDGRFSGVLKLTLTAKTPLLIGGYEKDGPDGTKVPDVPRRRMGGRPMVPGSGLLGAVRSVHEALAGGCMRVLDTDWVAVHRHPANVTETRGLQLGVVLEVGGDGRAAEIGLCDQVVWVDQEILPSGHGRVCQTGDRLQLPAGKAVDSGDRKILGPRNAEPGDVTWRTGMSPDRDDSWVLLVSDTHARAPGKPVRFATGRLGSLRCEVPASTWELYERVAAGADDLRPANLPGRKEPSWDPQHPEYRDVPLPVPAEAEPGPVIAKRLAVRRYLYRGQPVWVRVSGQQVTEIRISLLWRYAGDYPVGDRVGGAAPCADPEKLCWSCRVFGSADTSGRRDDDIARQRSYRGHVRADDLIAARDFQPIGWQLAPLAAPKPGAGQFYLDNTAVKKKLAERDTSPAATWGSCADVDRPRPIRGRKFYWRTRDPDKGEHPRGRRRHQSDTQTRDVVLTPAGTVYSGRVTFENLSVEDYGSLLVALDPRLLAATGLAEWQGSVTSVGGGKPFGFGAVTIDIAVEQMQTAAGRYRGDAGAVPGIADAVAAFRERVPHRASATWPALQHALEFGFIQDELVWYPPGEMGSKGDAEFDRSFAFFARTTGLALKDKARDLVVLPSAAAPAAEQLLDSTAGERQLDTCQQRPGRGSAWNRPEGGRRG